MDSAEQARAELGRHPGEGEPTLLIAERLDRGRREPPDAVRPVLDEDAVSTTSSATVEQDEQDVQHTSSILSEQASQGHAPLVAVGVARPAGIKIGGTTGSTSSKVAASDVTPALASTSDTLPGLRDYTKRTFVTGSERSEVLGRDSPEPSPPPTPTSTDGDGPASPDFPRRMRSFAELERQCEDEDEEDDEVTQKVEVQVAGVAKKRTKKRHSTFELIVPIRRTQPKMSSKGRKSPAAPVVRRTSVGREVKPSARYSDKGSSRSKQK